ncbi:hypothetical protein JK635_02460 [Neobacillus sp. YIM B02564]|uniref:Uncharacterized protein n=1 Tax=Neobacillus paridis TaxID=2803862 RepID=A0ABS1TKQ8_9BACI|nr:hypothetical protein [Neobacillus paridis]MBL4951103.1 hypothetical protein [Neobacillus paridis]
MNKLVVFNFNEDTFQFEAINEHDLTVFPIQNSDDFDLEIGDVVNVKKLNEIENGDYTVTIDKIVNKGLIRDKFYYFQ